MEKIKDTFDSVGLVLQAKKETIGKIIGVRNRDDRCDHSCDVEGIKDKDHMHPSNKADNIRKMKELQKKSSVRQKSTINQSEEKKIEERCGLKAPRMVFGGAEPGNPGHSKSVLCVTLIQWGDRGNLVLSGGEGKLAHLWSVAAGLHVAELAGHLQRVSAVAVYICPKEGPIAITASWDETIRFWSVASCFDDSIHEIPKYSEREIPVRTLDSEFGHVNRIYSLAVSHGTQPMLCSGSSDNTIKLWSLPEGNYMYELRDRENVTWYLSLDCYRLAHETFIASGCRDNSIKVWKVKEPTFDTAAGYHRSVPQLVISNLVSRVHSLCVVQLKMAGFLSSKRLSKHISQSGAPEGTPEGSSPTASSSASGLQTTVVALCKDVLIRVFSVHTGALLRVLEGGHTSPILSVYALPCLDNTDAYLVSSSVKGNICVWNYSTGELQRFFNGHFQECLCVSIHQIEKTQDLLIVSGGRDRSVRTWLYTEEQGLFNKTQSHRINCVATYGSVEEALIFTGADDGSLQAEIVSDVHRCDDDSHLWHVANAHPARIRSVCVYTPVLGVVGASDENPTEHHVDEDGSGGVDLAGPLLISGGRGRKIRVTDALDGSMVGPYLEGHTAVITSLVCFNGLVHQVQGIPVRIMPFIVSGSEDDTVRLWDLQSGIQLKRWEGHELDVLAVAVYVPPVLSKKEARKKRRNGSAPSTATSGRSGVSKMLRNESRADMDAAPVSTLVPYNPIIVSAGMDCQVCVWSYQEKIVFDEDEEYEDEDEDEEKRPGHTHLLATLDNEVENTHLNCVAVADVDFGPVIVAGGGNGNVLLWTLEPPYTVLESLKGHSDEIMCLTAYFAAGHGQILATGSCDRTVRVWSLTSMVPLRVLEGHTMDVTGVSIFIAGSGDPAIASVSTDRSFRVMFDFLGGMPKSDYVENQFYLDMQDSADSAISIATSGSGAAVKWPRIMDLANKQNSKDSFFSTFYKLFSLAVQEGRSDFLNLFLPGMRLALLKTNSMYDITQPGEGRKEGTLLGHAMHLRDRVAVHCIVGCWIAFLTAEPTGGDMDILYDPHARLRLSELLELADYFPREFERFICGIKLIPVIPALLPPSGTFQCLFQGHGHKITMEQYQIEEDEEKVLRAHRIVPTHYGLRGLWNYWSGRRARRVGIDGVLAAARKNTDQGDHRVGSFSFLPVPNMVHLDLLKAYIRVCIKLDSVRIFDSDAGQLGLAYIWRDVGLWIHSREMFIHIAYLVVASVSLYSFSQLVRLGHPTGAMLLLGFMSLFDLYQGYKEVDEVYHHTRWYFADGWNVLDVTYVVCAGVGNVFRFIHMEDTFTSRTALSIACVAMWLHMFYFLRAFESTGPLVSMILRIWVDMQSFLAVALVSIIGFSQAFWVLSNSKDSNDTFFASESGPGRDGSFAEEYKFSTVGNSLIYSYAFMLGAYDPAAFDHLETEAFARILSAAFMLIGTVLLLNLLIALMADSYATVKRKGLAQWRFEQAELILDNEFRMPIASRVNESWVFTKKSVLSFNDDNDIAENTLDMEVELQTLSERVEELQGQNAEILKMLHLLSNRK